MYFLKLSTSYRSNFYPVKKKLAFLVLLWENTGMEELRDIKRDIEVVVHCLWTCKKHGWKNILPSVCLHPQWLWQATRNMEVQFMGEFTKSSVKL